MRGRCFGTTWLVVGAATIVSIAACASFADAMTPSGKRQGIGDMSGMSAMASMSARAGMRGMSGMSGVPPGAMQHMEHPKKSASIPFALALRPRGWTVTASSAMPGHPASAVLGSGIGAYWQSGWLGRDTRLPQTITIRFPVPELVSGLRYIPRARLGEVGLFRVSLSPNGTRFQRAVAYGRWQANTNDKKVAWTAQRVRAVRLTVLSVSPQRASTVAAARIVLSGKPRAGAQARKTTARAATASTSPSVVGQWGPTIGFPLVPVAAALIPGNKLVVWSADENLSFGGSSSAFTQTAILDLTTGAVTASTISNTAHNMFCPGVSILPDGEVMVTGGISDAQTSIYNPATNTWRAGPPMNIGRGYQGQTTLSDGQAFVLGGSWSGGVGGKLGEVWSPTGGWRELGGVPADPMYTADPGGIFRADNHGWFIATSGGKVLQAGPSAQMHWITTTGAGSITPAGARGTAGDQMNGNAVLYDVGKILTVGGATAYENTNATPAANVVDISTGSAQVTSSSSMAYARSFANSVALPDGHVFTVGGESLPVTFSDQNSDMTPEMWDPGTRAWTAMAPQPEPRNYHSVGVLLPDGTVFSGGGGLCGTCATNHPDGQIFYPPYLFNADGSRRTRPTIASAPSSAATGQTISVTTGGPVQSFVLMRYDEATHTVDNDQRRIPLTITSSTGNTYRLAIPSDPGVALPGPYMLFAIDANGTPSVSTTISISTPPASAPTNTYGTAVDAAGPAVYWPLADSAGSTGAADLSGNRDTGSFSASGITYQTPSPVEGAGGQGVTLAGGQIISNQPQPAPNTYSEELWFKTTSGTGGALMRFGDSSTGANSNTDRILYMTSSGQLTFGVWTGTTNTITSPSSYNDGSWHFAVVTQSGNGMRLYVDGHQVAQNSVTSAQAYTGYWQLGGTVNGGWPSRPTTAFSGSMSDAAMYLSELTAAQVQSEYVASTGSAATPTLSTSPSATSVTLGSASATLKDTATLSGGSSPTGTITFTLVYGGVTVDTETVTVSGNGSYSTPVGYTLPGNGTVTGSYQWNALYSGDSNNNTVSDNNNANERVTVSAASPALSTTPSATSVTVGSSSLPLKDTATLSGGSSPTGTITFTLVYGGVTVDTETATVNGNGSYSTPVGYTLPASGTVTGSYQWNATYSGDGRNSTVSETNNAAERVTVSGASPSLSTTPSATSVTVGSSSLPLKDTATLSGGSSPTGTITFTLVYGGVTVDTETVSVNGNGSYSTPVGYTLPGNGTVTGSYQWNATYSGDGRNSAVSDTSNAAERVTVSAASPSLSTTPSATSVTLGSSATTLKDTATLSSGSSPTGTITFTLVYGGVTVDTETVTVSGNGSYSTPVGYTLPTSVAVTGSYQWNALYSGDSNNTTVSETNNVAERVTVNAASPSLSTTPSTTSVTLGSSAAALKDTATVSGGSAPTGTLTFTLVYGGVTVDTETVSVNGNGTYSTPVGYTLPGSGTVTGSYQWNAAYAGDANNNAVSDNNNANERVTVSAASPALSTTPSATSVTVGSSSLPLKDTATLSGGSSPTGTITFTLVYGGLTVDTETVSVSGNGSYSTPVGYTLPASGTVTGSYQWNATYSGDGRNSAVSETNNAAERVTVSATSPGLSTTPSATTVTLGSSSQTLKDTATLSSGSSPTGTLTFTLVYGGVTVDTETVSVSGNGSYTTPVGYTLPASGAVTGSYQWNATYSGDGSNGSVSETNNQAERVAVSAATPSLSTTPSATSVTVGSGSLPLKDTASLSGGSSPTGTITFTLVYGGITVDTETVTVSGNGSYSTPTGYTLPASGAVTGSYQWNATYAGDANNNTASETNNAAERVTVNAASPGLSTTPSAASVTLGSSATALKDTATLSGGSSPTGTITFTLVYGGLTVDTETATVNGNGSYSTPTGYTLPGSGTVTGSYQWNATYSGDGRNSAVSETNNAAERVTVSAASPGLATTPSATSMTLGTSAATLKDTATLSGGSSPTGTITFTLVYGGITVDTETVPVHGNGSYSTPTGYSLPASGTVTGSYQWNATYAGDANNNTASETNNAAERVTVNAASPGLSTIPSLTGSASKTLTDTASLSGGSAPSGTITFTLLYKGQTVDTETVSVSGNGSYSTPTGYTLPTSGTVTGSYQWNATYSGDGNNAAVSETNNQGEQITIGATSPALTTAPSPTSVTLGSASATLKDSATLSGGSSPTGTITFTLVYGGVTVDTETVTVNGNGSYSTPVGYTLPASGTVTGSYQWNAAYSGDSNNSSATDTNNPNEQVPVTAASPALSTSASPANVTFGSTSSTLQDTAVLSGGSSPTGTITFTLVYGGVTVDTETATVSGNGSYSTPTGYRLPTTGIVTGDYQWDAVYSGDANNHHASASNEPSAQVVVSTTRPTVSITSPAAGATYRLGQQVVSSFSCTEAPGGPGVSACVDQSGNASGGQVDTSTLGPHTYTVTATSRDGEVGSASVSYTVSQTSVAIPTTTAIIAHSPNPSLVGQPVTVFYSVTAPGGTPTGNVTVSDGIDTCHGTVAAGQCSLRIAKAGVHVLAAAYGGDGTFSGSTSAEVRQTVARSIKPLVRISAASETNRSFRAAPKAALARISRQRPPVGTTFRYKLDHPAPVRFEFMQPSSGRLVDGKCLARTARNQRNRACTPRAGSLTFAGHSGLNSVRFAGWFSGSKRLIPGDYTLVITAITTDVGSTSQRLTFNVLP